MAGLAAASGVAQADPFDIDRAQWRSSDRVLRVDGEGTRGRTVTVRNAGNNVVIGTTTVERDEEWDIRIGSPSPVPCTITAQQSGSSEMLTVDVRYRPSDCGPVPDAQAPSAPGTLTATAAGTSRTDLTWSASTDNVGVAAYRLERCQGSSCTGFVEIAAPTGTSYSDSGLTAATDYRYRARAVDAAGNLSGYSTIAAARTQQVVSDDGGFRITRARWSSDKRRIEVEGDGTRDRDVTVHNAFALDQVLGTDEVEDDGDWRVRREMPSPIPCRVRAEQEGGQVAEMNVSNAPSTCAPQDNNNPPPVVTPSISINNVTVTEGATTNFAVTLSAASTQTVTVVASTANGTAVAPGDFTARSNVTLTFPAGSTSQAFAVTTINDTAVENTETFTVNLTSAVNATVADNQGVGTINDNDVAPQQPAVSINNVTVTEGATANFAVTLSAASTQQVTVVASTANGTAAAPGDFTARSNVTLTFPAGSTSQTFAVITINDTAVEQTETFNVNLSGAVNATIADNQGVGTINDNDQAVADCNPVVDGDHRNCITDYTGPEVCVACHETESRDMHGSVHYQQNGPTDFVTNIDGPAGERGFDFAATGINTYCGTHESSPRFTCAGCHVGNGRFPKSVDEFSQLPPNDQLHELANIDCLMCHQQTYKRFPDPAAGFEPLILENVSLSNGVLVEAPGSIVTRTGIQGIPIVDAATLDFDFIPADPTDPLLVDLPANFRMTVTALDSAQTVHPTSRQSCLNCHAGAAGADGAKRGDLSSLLANPPLTLDRHMSPAGSNMTCADCHDAGGHRMRGRGLDLRPNDLPPATSNPAGDQFACTACHTATTVHSNVSNGTTFARHVAKVACQTCHIPRYGKGVQTEIARDWQAPGVSQTACNGRGGWLPHEVKGGDLVPTYAWFDGTSEIYYLTESLTGVPTVPLTSTISTTLRPSAGSSAGNFDANDPAVSLAVPAAIVDANGAINRALGARNPDAKIYPMKEHWGKLARNTRTDTLIGHSTFEFFRTGDFDLAVREGLAQTDGMSATDAYTVVPVHTFQTINHGVEPSSSALGVNGTCGSCHNVPISPFTTGKPLRMNLRDMGYAVTRAGISVGSNGTVTCSVSCHGNETGNFTNIHSRNNHRNAGCTACHANR